MKKDCIQNPIKKFNIFGLISKYRTGLMGLATIFVYIFHDPIYTNHPAINAIKNRLFIGVDIFIFLSGYGLYYASLKRQTIKSFYIKRIKRVYPTFLVVACIVCMIKNSDFRETLSILSTIGYWWGDSFQSWYISAILVFYLLFPFYLKWFNPSPYKTTFQAVIIGVLITIPAYIVFPDLRIGFFSRIPIFSIGVLSAYIANNKPLGFKENSLIKTAILLISTGLCSTLLLYTTLKPYSAAWCPLPFIFVVPGLIILLILFCEKNNNSPLRNRILSALIFIGNLSLEFYLIHEPILHLMPYPTMTKPEKVGYIVILGLLSLGLALLLNKLITWINHIFAKQLSSDIIS